MFKKYITIWDKFSTEIRKECDSEPVYNKSVLKCKIKSYGDEPTDFHDKDSFEDFFDSGESDEEQERPSASSVR